MSKYNRYSYSALNVFKVNRERWYCSYISKNKLKRTPPTEAMSMGSFCDARIKKEMMNDLGMICRDAPLSKADLEMSDDMCQWIHDSGQYDKLLDYFKEILNRDGKVLFETEIVRQINSKVRPYSILGYSDFQYKEKGNAPWQVIDMKVTNIASENPYSPRPPYNKAFYKNGKVKDYSKFEQHPTEVDDWVGCGTAIPKMHSDQVELYNVMLNKGVEGIEWDGMVRGGIFQVTKEFIACSYGCFKPQGIMKEFENMNKHVANKKYFGLEKSEKETKALCDMWDQDAYRACCLTDKFF